MRDATDFDQRFHTQTANTLTLALNHTLQVAGGHASHQARFVGNWGCARAQARCELNDLFIVTHSSISREARLTFLRAKSERATPGSACRHKFEANLEQWFLLSQRTPISDVSNFARQVDLLANALLQSMGSFAFFARVQEFQTFYTATNYLNQAWRYTLRGDSPIANPPSVIGPRGRYPESAEACYDLTLSECLISLEIWTPLHTSLPHHRHEIGWQACSKHKSLSHKAVIVHKHLYES